jgi:hypothetical protein
MEFEAIRAAVNPIDQQSRLYYLQQAIKRGDSAADLRKTIDAVREHYDPFFAKYGTHSHELAKKTVETYAPLLKQAEELIPLASAGEDMGVSTFLSLSCLSALLGSAL